MKIINVHERTIPTSEQKIADLLTTLASSNDKIWPWEQWPRMRLDKGLKTGAKGGHGPIAYTVKEYAKGEFVIFEFFKPSGFYGTHKFEITPLSAEQTQIKHTIDMRTNWKGTFIWSFAIRSLHNALIEDAFDKIENQFQATPKRTPWGLWVKILRRVLR